MATPEQPKKIRIQAVGWLPAIEASELEVGDQRIYNFGSTHQITKIEEASPKFLTITSVSTETGEEYTSRVKKTSLVARASERDRHRLGHDAPATAYRAQILPPNGPGWITVSHGATAEDATRGNATSGHPSYFDSVMLDHHGLGYTSDNPNGRADSVKAMTDGETLTAEDGHSFRILPPKQPEQPALRVVEGTVIPAGHTLGIPADHADDVNARDAYAALVAAGHTPAELSNETDEDDNDTARGTGFMLDVRDGGRVLVYQQADGNRGRAVSDYKETLRAYRRTLRAAGWECGGRIFLCVQAWRTSPLPEGVTAAQTRGETAEETPEGPVKVRFSLSDDTRAQLRSGRGCGRCRTSLSGWLCTGWCAAPL
jgi:hypothetical protein